MKPMYAGWRPPAFKNAFSIARCRFVGTKPRSSDIFFGVRFRGAVMSRLLSVDSCSGLLWRAAPWARRRDNQRHLGSVARRGWHVQAGQQLFFGEPPIRQHEIAVSLLRLLAHLQYLPVRPAWAGAWGTTQRRTPQGRWSASDPSASPYQRWHRSGPRVGDPLVAAPSSS